MRRREGGGKRRRNQVTEARPHEDRQGRHMHRLQASRIRSASSPSAQNAAWALLGVGEIAFRCYC